MATVPNCDRAIVERAKVADYLLSASHPIGRAKARFFKRFGFRDDRPEELVAALLAHINDHEISDIQATVYGVRYRVDGALQSPDGRDPHVSSVWIILDGEPNPRFITAFPC